MGRGRVTLADIAPKCRPQLEALIAAQPRRSISDLLAGRNSTVQRSDLPTTEVRRIRQKDGDGLNKTERAFFEWLKAKYRAEDGFEVGSQRLRFRLANGAWYKPDNDLFERATNKLTLFEVKGYMRPKDALTLKVVASVFPWLQFTLVTNKGGAWNFMEVRP